MSYNPSPEWREMQEKRIAEIDSILSDIFEKHPEIDHIKYHDIYSPYENANECCFHCEKCFSGCSWAKEFKPIEGWVALKNVNEKMDSYKIFYCPEFEAEDHEKRQPMDYEAAFNLLCAIASGAANRYRDVLHKIMNFREEYPFHNHNGEFCFNYRNLLSEKEQLEETLAKFYSRIQREEGFDEEDNFFDECILEKTGRARASGNAKC